MRLSRSDIFADAWRLDDRLRPARPPAPSAPAAKEKREAVTSLKDPQGWFFNAIGGGLTASGKCVTPDGAKAESAVYACVGIRASTIAQLPLKLYRRTGTQREQITNHPSARLVARPNGAQTSFLWRAFSQSSIDTRGGSFARILRDQYYRPLAAVPIRNTSEVRTDMTDRGDIVFRYRGELLGRGDMLQIPAIDTIDGICGVSPIMRMRETLGVSIAAKEHGARTFANGVNPSGVLQYPGNFGTGDDEQAGKEILTRLREQFSQQYSGTDNAGRPIILEDGMTWNRISMSNQDAQFLDTRRFEVEEVARYYGVPLQLIGSGEKTTSWGTGVAELVEGFVKFTIAPLCVHWEEMLNITLLTEREQDDGYYFAFSLDALLRGNLQARATALKIMRDGGVISANEWRRLEDMNDLPDTIGDVYLQPLNYVPAGSPAASGQEKPAQPASQS